MKKVALLLAALIILSGCIGPLANQKASESASTGQDTEGTEEGDKPGTSASQNTDTVSDIPGPDGSEYKRSDNYDYTGEGNLEVHFIKAGQADSTLLKGPDSNILVDTGDWQGEDVVEYLESQGIEKIDLIILTHLDADHIGQAEEIINKFEVEEVWMSGKSRSTETFKDLVDTILDSDIGYYEPRRGDVFTVGEIELEVLHPESTPTASNVGIMTRATFGETSIMFSGDAEGPIEEDVLNSGQNLDSDIYQVGHHGSSDSSTGPFVRAIDPRIAVYSAGKDNQYGHPDDEVISRLNEIGAEVYGTPVHGTVILRITGDGEISVETENSEPTITAPAGALTGFGWKYSINRGVSAP